MQIFHCLEADPHGGDTLLVDGFQVAIVSVSVCLCLCLCLCVLSSCDALLVDGFQVANPPPKQAALEPLFSDATPPPSDY